MSESQLGQTLLVSPDTTFAEIADVIQRLGWSRETSNRNDASLIAGEPELAHWTWHGKKPFVVYTFNPVVRLRVLDVGTCPPAFRGGIASRLRLVTCDQVRGFLASANPRERLLGLWAAQEQERLDLLPAIEAMQADPDRLLAGESEKVTARLSTLAQARIETMAGLSILTGTAGPVIEQLHNSNFVQQLCPSRSDCARLFDAELAETLALGAQELFRNQPTVAPGADYSRIRITAAPAGLFRFYNELSDQFPQGYRTIAGWMSPDRIWLTWAYESSTGGRVRYDGLAWLEDHWVWIPKPFRIITPQVLEIAAAEG